MQKLRDFPEPGQIKVFVAEVFFHLTLKTQRALKCWVPSNEVFACPRIAFTDLN